MDCTVDLANCDVIFHSSHVKIRCSLSDFGIDMESKACLGFGCGTLRILQLTITESFTVLGLVGSRGFQHFVLYSRQIIRDHDWVNSHTHTHDMHAAGCCNICKRSLLLSWNLFNLAVETKIRPYPASLPAGEETVPKLQETSPVHGFQQCHFSPYYQTLFEMFRKLPKELALESSEQVGADLGEDVEACLIWT